MEEYLYQRREWRSTWTRGGSGGVPGPEEGVEEFGGGNVVAVVAHLVELPVFRVANSKLFIKMNITKNITIISMHWRLL